ncbi:MAG: GNAT family N-acetyltransferase [Nocardioidaceae bacterium]
MKYPDDVPVRTDGTVTLRALRVDDADGVYEHCVDPLTQEHTSVRVPYRLEDARYYVGSRGGAWEQGVWSFAIQSPWGVGAGGFSGSISLTNEGSGLAEINYSTHPQVRGHGVTTAAVRLICDWAFEEQGVRTILWQAYEGNVASRRIAWKTGFTFEGASRGTVPQRGELRDGWRATLLATDSRQPKTRWVDPVILENDLVRLRPLRAEDEQRYLATNGDPETLVWLGGINFPRDAEHFHRHLARGPVGNSLGASVEWAMADPVRDHYVGTINLFGMTGLDYLSAEVGYRTHPDSRGRGLLRAAMMLAAEHAFTPEADGGLGLERISLNAGVGNHGSLGVARSCGFAETGLDRQCYDLIDGRVVDLVRFDLLRSEFPPRV